MHVVRGRLILLGLLLLLTVLALLPLPLFAESRTVNRTNVYTVRRYGPMVVYYSDKVSAMLFDESFFNYSYRNVYVYITDRDIAAEVAEQIEDFINVIHTYFPVNPHFAVIGVPQDSPLLKYAPEIVNAYGRCVAKNLSKEITDAQRILGFMDCGDAVLIIVGSVRGFDEAAKLLYVGEKISSMQGKRVVIASTTPFDGFFTRRYNGTAIAYEAAEAVRGIGLGRAIIGTAMVIPAYRVYAVLWLNKGELDRIAKSSNTDVNTLVKTIIDAIRARVPEDIPLSILIGEASREEPLSAPAINVTVSATNVQSLSDGISSSVTDTSTATVATATAVVIAVLLLLASPIIFYYIIKRI